MPRIKVDGKGLAALLGVLVALLACWLYSFDIARYPSLELFTTEPIGGDFGSFYAASQLILQNVADGVYLQQILSKQIATFNLAYGALYHKGEALLSPIYYPPVYLLFIGPLSLLPFFPALLAFFISTGVVYMAGLWQLVREKWVLLFMCGFAGIWVNLITGQNGLLTAGLMALALSQLNKNQMLAGLFIGLACYKPHLGLLWPFVLLAGGYYRAFFFAGVTVAGLIAYTIIVFGLETWLAYSFGAEAAMWVLANMQALWMRMPTLYAMMRLQGSDYTQAILLQLSFTLPVALAVMRIWYKSQDMRLKGSALAVGALLATPFVYDYDYAMLGIALVLLMNYASERGWRLADKILLPLAYIWPVLINQISYNSGGIWGGYWQVGFLPAVAILLLIYVRVAVDSRASSALKPAV